MNNEITIPGETPSCECGNALGHGQVRCSKCLARDRWARKERARNRRNRQRSDNRRPPRGPRTTTAAGVSWA
ncbi:hypothetical protein FH608_035110 [Nonomuraea phyllanthi]|uniref:Uncharacterized protein n=1 Tax=Nonomuraea phyllanthi TaxID=2219224 RepID=A0A5C4VWS6_9ACTN|nr:hypothetical protein [Nonomuraea phyllanthi]KAB8190218.1 hypothetical protein FH608_035110 [Nonomuraea phyllanthi]